MSGFRYENQGTETMLVYHLDREETLDEFSKGMLQENEIAGVLKPSFAQKDMERYIKYPVTSKVPLKDFMSGEMERKTVMKIFLSMAEAMREMEEYMLSQEKILLDPAYIFVDIRRKETSLVYLPVDEFSQEVPVKEFLLGMLSHMRFCMDDDVSYVAKLIHFLNQSKPWEFDALKRYIETLMNEEKPVPFNVHGQAASLAGAQAAVQREPKVYVPEEARTFSRGVPQEFSQPVPRADGNGAEKEITPEKKKGGLFGKKESKEKAEKKRGGLFGGKGTGTEPGRQEIAGAPVIPGVPAVPGGPEIPGMSGVLGGPVIPEAPAIAGGPNGAGSPMIPGVSALSKTPKESKNHGLFGRVAESGMSRDSGNLPPTGVPDSDGAGSQKGKPKKGLFGLGKKKEVKPPIVPMTPVVSQVHAEVIPASRPVIPVSQPVPEYCQEARPEFTGQEGETVYMGHGNSEDENRTVILGGEEENACTVLLGQGGSEGIWNSHVIRLTRRRTGQSVVINQEVFRIGSAGDYVDFYIADNPAIGGWHADITEADGAWYIMDRNSANHTYVNGVMVEPMQAVQLGNGAVITLADEDFEFIIS